jgi:hypothetical protein
MCEGRYFSDYKRALSVYLHVCRCVIPFPVSSVSVERECVQELMLKGFIIIDETHYISFAAY